MANRKNLEYQLNAMRLSAYRLFIFDFDGTLVKTLCVDWQNMKKALCRIMRIQYLPEITLAQLIGGAANNQKLLTRIFKVIAQYERRGLPRIQWNLPMLHFVQELKHQNKKIAIFSTNMRATIALALAAQHLQNQFDCVIGKEDVQHYKPHPEGLLMVLEKTGIPSQQACFIGDKNVDRLAGQQAKIHTIILSSPNAPS